MSNAYPWVAHGTPHPPEQFDNLRYLLQLDPTEPMVLGPQGGTLAYMVLDPDLPEVWGEHATAWFMARARYVALPPSTLTVDDVWWLNKIAQTHPDWLTGEDRAWVEVEFPRALLAAALG